MRDALITVQHTKEKKKNNKLIAEYDKILNSHNVLEREYNEYLKAISKIERFI